MRGSIRIGIFLAVTGFAVAAHAGVLAQDNVRVEYQSDDLGAAQHAMDVLIQAIDEFHKRLPVGEAPIRVVIAHTFDEFSRYASHFSQVSVMGIAKPRQGLIVVKAPRLKAGGYDYTGTLRHELVHILLYRNTNPDALPSWLNEGLAMSLANEYYWDSMFVMARLFMSQRLIEYRHLEFAFLAPGDEMEFGDAYAQALSMTRFLRKRVGEDIFWKIVLGAKEMGFPDALRHYAGISPLDFWEAYRHSLWYVVLIASIASGSFFTPAAILLIIAYLRKRRAGKRIIARMEMEEAEDEALGIQSFSWEEVVEDPDAWKTGPLEEDDRP